MSDVHSLSSLAWAERACLELVQLRLTVRIEFQRTAPDPWMMSVLDEDLGRAYGDAEIARLELARCLSDISAGTDLQAADLSQFADVQDAIWAELFKEHFLVRKELKRAIQSLEARSQLLGLAPKVDVVKSPAVYTGRPYLRAVPMPAPANS